MIDGLPTPITYNSTQKDVDIEYHGNPETEEQPADLYIIASNNISQKAYGPLDEVTYGDSYKNVHGSSTDIFYGTSYKETHGHATEMYYATKNTWITDADSTGKLAASLSMFLGISTSLNLSLSVGLSLSGKADVIVGADSKVVVGLSSKIVVGQDMSNILSGAKVVYADDTKVVFGVDIKNVTVDSKTAVFFMESKGAEIAKSVMTGRYAALCQRTYDLKADLETVSNKMAGLASII
jgi:hypothetical protein